MMLLIGYSSFAVLVVRSNSNPPIDENNPEEQLNETEMKELLKEALRTLPEKEALVVQLYYVEELNVYEIAEVLDVTTGRVSQIKKSAVRRLREFMQKANQQDVA